MEENNDYIRTKAMYICTKNYYMNNDYIQGSLVFKKDKIYIIEKYRETLDYIAAYITKDEENHDHYLDEEFIRNNFKLDTREATKILYKDHNE